MLRSCATGHMEPSPTITPREGSLVTDSTTSTPDRPNHRAAYSIRETCNLLGVSRSTLYRLMDGKRLRCVHIGRRVLIPAGEIERLLSSPTKRRQS
ncbi:MAG: helix-turn-helix domain-containing protein [Acidimicrobiia bacterium]|nr:helix-turn-helix domain-containing protein [Acidimicrobiia bacterium]